MNVCRLPKRANPMRAIVGAIVIGVMNRRRRPKIPVDPTMICWKVWHCWTLLLSTICDRDNVGIIVSHKLLSTKVALMNCVWKVQPLCHRSVGCNKLPVKRRQWWWRLVFLAFALAKFLDRILVKCCELMNFQHILV